MNVDEAMAYYAKRIERSSLFVFKYEEVIHALSDEVERLRAELAAAKAASVCPEESVIWLLAVAAKLEKDGESSRLDSMTKTAIWLRQRMKDKTPPQA